MSCKHVAIGLLVCAGLSIGLPALASGGGAAGCEVVSVSGDVQVIRKDQSPTALLQGSSVSVGDQIIVSSGAWADLAFDEAWENTARLNQNTRVTIRSLNPTKLSMISGDIYSKLDHLPAGSSFEVKTPTAVAVVKGTSFRTTHENGMTTVYNDSEVSPVYVYHLDENGNRSGRSMVLQPGESLTLSGEAEAFDSPLDELEGGRDREDQDQLNADLSADRVNPSNDAPNLIDNQNQ
ncbi:MAG: FecR domain-containing protein [Candidatus Omnitrophica bacterium]|nr:FecR domain-containing protein [Candidatus Omnitrophota bacterium]